MELVERAVFKPKSDKKEDVKKLVKVFIILFLISFLVINWSEISWIFNYRFIGRLFSSQLDNFKVGFNNKLELFTALINKKINISSEVFGKVNNSIEIPKLGISAPIVFSSSNNEKDLEKALKRGALYYPNSIIPGEKGTTVILGHSAPANWPKINYDWIFNDLNKLENGDKILIKYNNREFAYKVIDKKILTRGEELPEEWFKENDYNLVLLTCWPPGDDIKRLGILAKGDNIGFPIQGVAPGNF